MKPILRTLMILLAAAAIAAVLILVAAPPRGHAVVLLPAPTPSPILVHLTGAVRNPGLYELPTGSRLYDAVQAAGGLTESADSSAINLAALLRDGERYTVPEVGVANQPATNSSRAADQPILAGSDEMPININTATALELEQLPGIGPALAQQIVEYREDHGDFASIEAIMDVPQIGPAKFEAMRELITVN